MSVRHALLALLSPGPATTYQLRKDFERSTGLTWPLNIGQVSSTLERLARDGLVQREEGSAPDDSLSRDPWTLTDAGRLELAAWWRKPVTRGTPERDELVIKLALAVTLPDLDVTNLVQRQRSATLGTLHDITRLQRDLTDDDLAAALVLRHHVFALEAELRWLDDIEGSLHRVASQPKRRLPANAESRDHTSGAIR